MKGIDNILKPLYDLWHKVMDKLSVKDDVLLIDGKEVVVKMIVENIKQLSDSQCDELQCGDIVAKKTGNMFHLYQVTYKEDKHGICLTYQAAGLQETQSYDYIEGHWVYNSEDLVETNVADAPSGTAASMLGIDSNGKVVKDSIPGGHTDAEVKALAVDAVEEATSGTVADILGLDSDGNLVKGAAPSGDNKIYKHSITCKSVGGLPKLYKYTIGGNSSPALSYSEVSITSVSSIQSFVVYSRQSEPFTSLHDIDEYKFIKATIRVNYTTYEFNRYSVYGFVGYENNAGTGVDVDSNNTISINGFRNRDGSTSGFTPRFDVNTDTVTEA